MYTSSEEFRRHLAYGPRGATVDRMHERALLAQQIMARAVQASVRVLGVDSRWLLPESLCEFCDDDQGRSDGRGCATCNEATLTTDYLNDYDDDCDDGSEISPELAGLVRDVLNTYRDLQEEEEGTIFGHERFVREILDVLNGRYVVDSRDVEAEDAENDECWVSIAVRAFERTVEKSGDPSYIKRIVPLAQFEAEMRLVLREMGKEEQPDHSQEHEPADPAIDAALKVYIDLTSEDGCVFDMRDVLAESIAAYNAHADWGWAHA